MSEPTTAPLDAALERAHAQDILVARLNDDVFRAQSSEPTLRGPYLVLVCNDGDAACECLGGRHREWCMHKAAVVEAYGGRYPLSDVAAIRGPTDFAAPRRETRRERWAREIAEYDAVSEARRTQAPPPTARDYQELFPD